MEAFFILADKFCLFKVLFFDVVLSFSKINAIFRAEHGKRDPIAGPLNCIGVRHRFAWM